MSDKNTTIAKNSLFLSIRMVLVLFVSIYTSRVFLNALGVIDYGIINVVSGFVAMFSFLNTSLANGVQRFYNSSIGKLGAKGVTLVFNTSLIIQASIALIVFFLLETGGLWFFYEKMVIPPERMGVAFWLFQFSAISAAIVIMQTPFSAAIMAHEKMNAYALISILDVFLKLAFAIALPYINYDRLLIYGFFSLGVVLINFVINLLYCKCKFRYLYLKNEFNKGMFRNMLSFSGWNLFGTFACMAREQGLNVVLNLFFGPVVNAARGIAYQVSSALQGFVANLSLAAKPQMVESYAGGNSSRTIRLMYSMSKLSFIFLFVLAVPILLNIDFILHIWLGDIVPEHTASFIVLVIMASFMNNLNAPLSNVVYATGKMKNYEVTFSVINLLIIPISYIALCFGAPAESAFLVYFIMTIFVQIGCLLVLRTLIDISLLEYTKKLIVPIMLIVTIAMPLIWIFNGFLNEGWIRLFTEYLLITVISVPLFYLFSLDKAEKNMVNSIVKKFRIKQ